MPFPGIQPVPTHKVRTQPARRTPLEITNQSATVAHRRGYVVSARRHERLDRQAEEVAEPAAAHLLRLPLATELEPPSAPQEIREINLGNLK
jgi:hypothetical protein